MLKKGEGNTKIHNRKIAQKLRKSKWSGKPYILEINEVETVLSDFAD